MNYTQSELEAIALEIFDLDQAVEQDQSLPF